MIKMFLKRLLGSKIKLVRCYTTVNNQIIRKLGYYETILNEQCSKGYLQMLYTLSFEFNKVDLYSNLNVLTNAIKLWQSQHPFLNCTVLNSDKKDDENQRLSFERYFKRIENAEKKLRNVEYLQFKSNSVLNERDALVRLNDLFLNCPIPIEIEYLWRLIFIRFQPHKYCLIFNCTHDIGSGKTAHCLTKQLLKIIDALINQKQITADIFKVYPVPKTIETLLYDNNEKLIDDIKLQKDDVELNNRFFKAPESILETTQPMLQLDGMLLNYEDNSLYPVNKLLNSRAVKFKLDKLTTKKLLDKFKMHSVKPTGCFGTIISTATYKALKEYKIDQTEIVYASSVNLNQFLKDKLEPGQMGYYGTRDVHKIEADSLEKVLNGKEFDDLWMVSKLESEKIFRNIKEKRIFEFPKLRKADLEKMSKSKEKRDFNEYKLHFILSNIGSIETLPEFIGDFKILDLYCETTTPKFGINSQLFIAYLLMTADELHIAFEMSTALKSQFNNCIVDNVKETINRILGAKSENFLIS